MLLLRTEYVGQTRLGGQESGEIMDKGGAKADQGRSRLIKVDRELRRRE